MPKTANRCRQCRRGSVLLSLCLPDVKGASDEIKWVHFLKGLGRKVTYFTGNGLYMYRNQTDNPRNETQQQCTAKTQF